MNRRLIVIVMLTFGVFGCSSSDYENYQLFPEEYVSDVEYDSIYHYGYNQGCESALSTKGVPDMVYMRDITLDKQGTRFEQGWEDGNSACKDGVRIIMPTLIIEKN
ncbi:hypothetical protein C942_04547 [Photobacterium marinum]|uniref:Lipoprotein n=1 Tax=Photobacterium marinum TaxID=1056511 RepID=L8JF43_9GAMM|nr:hypothetical protein [Photobacterium marinum]ELR66848.1 hypothetical protein C942_04547 [Photobacterium marinum]